MNLLMHGIMNYLILNQSLNYYLHYKEGKTVIKETFVLFRKY